MIYGERYEPTLDDMIFWLIQSEAGFTEDEMAEWPVIEVDFSASDLAVVEMLARRHNCSVNDFVVSCALMKCREVLRPIRESSLAGVR